MIYRTSAFWDIFVPFLVGMSIVYFLEFIYNLTSVKGKIGAYINGNPIGLSIEEKLWSPTFEGRKGSLPTIMKLPGVTTSDQKLLTAMERHFTRYQPETSLIPTWVVTPPNVSTIHRFFDSSPFSPSGRYLGLTRMPNIFKRRDAGSKDRYKKGHKYVDGGEMRAEVVDSGSDGRN